MKLSELLPNDVVNPIRRTFRIETVEELREIPLSKLLKGRNLGPKRIEIIRGALGISKKRSLYQCFNVKFPKDGEGMLLCSKRHEFPLAASVKAVARGAPLILSCCQNCEDYDEMGPSVPASERGWLNLTPEKT